MKAVILAGGKGTRLLPLTQAIPKPMLPIEGRPMLEQIILHLKKHGITEITLSIGYLGGQIKDYFKDGSELGVSIDYAEEREPLGTAGCLHALKSKLTDTFLLVGGDNLTNLDYTRFIASHKEKKADLSVALTEISIPVEFGIYEIDENQQVSSFKEKPVFKHLAGTMIFCIEPSVLAYVHEGFSNLTSDILPLLLKDGRKIHGYSFSGFWADIGRMEDYRKFIL